MAARLAMVLAVLQLGHAASETLLQGIVSQAASLNTSSSCHVRLSALLTPDNRTEVWSWRVADASGDLGSGFLGGTQQFWLGSYSQCQLIPSARFHVASFRHRPTPVAFTYKDVFVGLCLPSECSVTDLAPLLQAWAARPHPFDHQLTLRSLRIVEEDSSWLTNKSTLILIGVMGVVLVLTGAGTAYDLFVWRQTIKKTNQPKEDWKGVMAVSRNIIEQTELLELDNNLNQYYEMKVDNSLHKCISATDSARPELPTAPSDVRTQSEYCKPATRFLLCFSFPGNASRVAVSRQGLSANYVHGLRFLAVAWIIFLHTITYMENYAQGVSVTTQRFLDHFSLALDSFLFVSGFLVAFVFLTNQKYARKTETNFSVKKKVNEFSFQVVKHFLRLSPLYFICVLLTYVSLTQSARSSVFELPESVQVVSCERFWWRNLLYVHNLYKGKDMCMSWSWLFSCDMQVFMASVFILITSTRFWKWCVVATVSVVVLWTMSTAYTSYILSSIRSDRVAAERFPWSAAGPYFIGLATGYYVVNLKGSLAMKQRTLALCWISSSVCATWVLCSSLKEDMSPLITALSITLKRMFWTLYLAWVVVSCCTRGSGVLKRFLCHECWVPLSKASPSAYLISPVVINVILANCETPLDHTPFLVVTYYFGFLTITYLLSLLLTVIVESPAIQLLRAMQPRKWTTNSLNT